MRKPTALFAVGGLLGVICLVSVIGLFSSGFSPASYVASKYQRATGIQTAADSRAFMSTDKPSMVAATIVDRWKPVSQYADGSGVYLRYPGDAIIIQPARTGSRIRVMDVDRAYRAYYGYVGGAGWGWTSTHGESFRGRGPGAGK